MSLKIMWVAATYECVDMAWEIAQDCEGDIDKEVGTAASDAVYTDGRHCEGSMLVWKPSGKGRSVRRTEDRDDYEKDC